MRMSKVMASLGLAFLMLLSGCQTIDQKLGNPHPSDEEWDPTVVEANEIKREKGSLFAASHSMTLFQDRRAYRVGDVLTVTLDEQTNASKSSDTSTGKSSDMNIEAPVIGNGSPLTALSATVNSSRNFNGEAASNQNNSLSGSITVTVSRVMANGILEIKGEKWLKLNQGDEFIRLKGLVRVDDIDEMNRIPSQRIANAEIAYAGRGTLSDSNSKGWLLRIFDSPLFPF